MRNSLIVFIAILLSGCSGTTLTGYGFETQAEYVAAKSGLTISISATGHVEPGNDTGEGESNCTISLSETGSCINIVTRNGFIKEVKVRGEQWQRKDSVNIAETLMTILETQGISADSDEITETETVIKACESGPKGTFMKGQTKFLSVVKTEFSRN